MFVLMTNAAAITAFAALAAVCALYLVSMVVHALVLDAIETGWLIGARRRLRAGTGSWQDLGIFCERLCGDASASRCARHARMMRLVSAGMQADRPWGDPACLRPQLPSLAYRWMRENGDFDLLIDSLDAGYTEETLTGHLDGSAVLDHATVQTMLALRS